MLETKAIMKSQFAELVSLPLNYGFFLLYVPVNNCVLLKDTPAASL